MNLKQSGWAVAALVLSVPVFAQTGVQSAAGVGVSSGTGVVVTPGVPSTTVVTPAPAAAVVTPAVSTTVVTPGATVAVAPHATISGATVAQAGTSETVSGNTRTIVTRYWVNVPAGVERDPEFQRWLRLR